MAIGTSRADRAVARRALAFLGAGALLIGLLPMLLGLLRHSTSEESLFLYHERSHAGLRVLGMVGVWIIAERLGGVARWVLRLGVAASLALFVYVMLVPRLGPNATLDGLLVTTSLAATTAVARLVVYATLAEAWSFRLSFIPLRAWVALEAYGLYLILAEWDSRWLISNGQPFLQWANCVELMLVAVLAGRGLDRRAGYVDRATRRGLESVRWLITTAIMAAMLVVLTSSSSLLGSPATLGVLLLFALIPVALFWPSVRVFRQPARLAAPLMMVPACMVSWVFFREDAAREIIFLALILGLSAFPGLLHSAVVQATPTLGARGTVTLWSSRAALGCGLGGVGWTLWNVASGSDESWRGDDLTCNACLTFGALTGVGIVYRLTRLCPGPDAEGDAALVDTALAEVFE